MSQAFDLDDVVDGALAQIDIGRWGVSGPKKVSLLSWLRRLLRRTPEGGLPLVAIDDFAQASGINNRRVDEAVGELVDEGVLIRLDPAGSRPAAYTVNPAVGEWRVPWRVDAALAVERVYNPPSFGRRREKNLQLPARQTARLSDFVARPVARQNDGCRATGRATTGPVVARQTARQTRRHLRAVSIPLDREDDEEEHAHTTRIADAITRRCGAPVVGRHRRRVAAAVEALDSAQLDYVERRIEDSAAGLSFAMLVALVDAAARDLAGGRVDPEAAPTGPLRGGAISEATILARNRLDNGFSEDDVRVELEAKYPPDVVEEAIAVHRHTGEAQ